MARALKGCSDRHYRNVVVLAPGMGGFGYGLCGEGADLAGAVKAEEFALGVFGFDHAIED